MKTKTPKELAEEYMIQQRDLNSSATRYDAFLEGHKARDEEVKQLKERLENALWHQQAAKKFINHFEDCNAVTEDVEEGFCECGMEEFAHNNELSRKISADLLQKIKGAGDGKA